MAPSHARFAQLPQVWGVTEQCCILFRAGVTAEAPRGNAWVSVGGPGVDDASAGAAAPPSDAAAAVWMGCGQVLDPDAAVPLAAPVVWLVTRAGALLVRRGIAAGAPLGTAWEAVHDPMAARGFAKEEARNRADANFPELPVIHPGHVLSVAVSHHDGGVFVVGRGGTTSGAPDGVVPDDCRACYKLNGVTFARQEGERNQNGWVLGTPRRAG